MGERTRTRDEYHLEEGCGWSASGSTNMNKRDYDDKYGRTDRIHEDRELTLTNECHLHLPPLCTLPSGASEDPRKGYSA